MSKLSIRTSEERKAALENIKDQYGMTITEIVNDAIRIWIKMHGDDLPEHLKSDTTHEDIVTRNRHKMRRLQFKQRVHDKMNSFLEDDRGNPRRFPPEPSKVEEEYIESLREEVEKEHDKYGDEYLEFLDSQLQWYSLQHPDYRPAKGREPEECIRLVAEQYDMDQPEYADQLATKMANSNSLSPSWTAKKLKADAKELLENERWRDEWESAAWGEKEDA